MTSDYFGWQDAKTRPRRTPAAKGLEPQEHEVAPSEPLKVEEHHASTTVIERIRDAIRNRLRGEG